jgi:hypothetical protein
VGIESRRLTNRNSTVTGGYNISPPCYVTVRYGVLYNCYAVREVALGFWRSVTLLVQGVTLRGVTPILAMKVGGVLRPLALMVGEVLRRCYAYYVKDYFMGKNGIVLFWLVKG